MTPDQARQRARRLEQDLLVAEAEQAALGWMYLTVEGIDIDSEPDLERYLRALEAFGEVAAGRQGRYRSTSSCLTFGIRGEAAGQSTRGEDASARIAVLRVGGQLNKGENLNGLRETVNFAHGGAIRHRQLVHQVAQALCLTLVVNCIAAFNAGLLPSAVEALRAAGFEAGDADVAHVGPTVTEHISVHGRYYYDLDRPPKGLRPAPARRLEPQPRPSTASRRPARAQRDCVDLRRCSSDGCVGF